MEEEYSHWRNSVGFDQAHEPNESGTHQIVYIKKKRRRNNGKENQESTMCSQEAKLLLAFNHSFQKCTQQIYKLIYDITQEGEMSQNLPENITCFHLVRRLHRIHIIYLVRALSSVASAIFRQWSNDHPWLKWPQWPHLKSCPALLPIVSSVPHSYNRGHFPGCLNCSWVLQTEQRMYPF